MLYNVHMLDLTVWCCICVLEHIAKCKHKMVEHPVHWSSHQDEHTTCWSRQYFGTRYTLEQAIFWNTLHVGAGCILEHTTCWSRQYFGTRYTLEQAVFGSLLYFGPWFFWDAEFWSMIYFAAGSILELAVFWSLLYTVLYIDSIENH